MTFITSCSIVGKRLIELNMESTKRAIGVLPRRLIYAKESTAIPPIRK